MTKPKESKQDTARVMKPQDFKRWRKALGFNQKEAAEALGLKRRVVQYYEKGEREGKKIEIPKNIRLACFALMEGVTDYAGPEDPDAPKTTKSSERSKPDTSKAGAPKADNAKDKAAAKPARKGKPAAQTSRKPRTKTGAATGTTGASGATGTATSKSQADNAAQAAPANGAVSAAGTAEDTLQTN